MTIKEYLNKIESLKSEKNTIVYSDNADLEFCMQKIKQNSEELFFTLDIFLKKRNSETTILNYEIIKLFENKLGLLFLEEESGNVCFANSDEVREEYRQSFKLMDLLDYIYAFEHSSIFTVSQKIIITSETELFWKLVKIGSGLREEYK
ncbi:hypothetical protein [Flavobacterium sp. DG2-3]|uniref:hypothetical protein n=1 Tax=Flavobacterium sp. DG2-3 TaxID=3068317 RepID=UPI00273F71FB|nr:hypothetical protein [Flavobacterium sp. DG2-3]MDP5200046.1 hypothetical protein [Flavobacterium sp. DG2-3]